MEVQQCLIFSLLKIYTVFVKHITTLSKRSVTCSIFPDRLILTTKPANGRRICGVSLDQLVNHPCTKDGLILEQKGPFTYAMEIDTADTLYLTREEVELIKGYRAMNPEDKLLLKKLL